MDLSIYTPLFLHGLGGALLALWVCGLARNRGFGTVGRTLLGVTGGIAVGQIGAAGLDYGALEMISRGLGEGRPGRAVAALTAGALGGALITLAALGMVRRRA